MYDVIIVGYGPTGMLACRPSSGEIIDVEGRYNQLMDEYGCDVIVKRDDYHIFGAARTVNDLPQLMWEMQQKLGRL